MANGHGAVSHPNYGRTFHLESIITLAINICNLIYTILAQDKTTTSSKKGKANNESKIKGRKRKKVKAEQMRLGSV